MRRLPVFLLLGAAATGLVAQAAKSDAKGLDWNQFRGPKRAAHAADTGLLKQWPAAGPALAWKATGIGVGHSSVAVSGQRVFTLGEDGGKCNLLALSATDGKLLWKLAIGGVLGDNQGGPGPRSTPATDGLAVIAIAPTGELVCVRAQDGRMIWQKHLARDFGANQPGFGFCESPLLDENVVVVSPGGVIAALNKANGGQIWRSKKLKGNTEYGSLSIAELGKVKQYLAMTDQGVSAVLATNGAVLWEGDFSGARAAVATPVYANGMVFASLGYGVGCKAFKVALAGGQIRMQEAYTNAQLQIHHGGMVVVDEHVYGLHDQGTLRCIELATGKMVWNERSVGKGSIIYADGHLICRGENGQVGLVEASPAAFKEKGKFTPPEAAAGKVWAHPAVSGGKLYLREQGSLFCYSLKE
jgi:outer membrane protein assembly factor BamB